MTWMMEMERLSDNEKSSWSVKRLPLEGFSSSSTVKESIEIIGSQKLL